MRYRLAVLMLFVVLPIMQLLAAPAPDPYGILDIGSTPKNKTEEQHLKFQIEFKTSPDTLNTICSYPEVKKLPSVASMKDARPWLAKNLRVKAEDGRRHLRFTFRAGKRDEQVTIINAFLRASLHWHDIDGKSIKRREEYLRWAEKQIAELEQRMELQPHLADTYREDISYLRYTKIPETRAEIARRKQYRVIRWAR